jgi:putative ABC transport system substrate-binding protein
LTHEKGYSVKRWHIFVFVLLLSSGFGISSTSAADRSRPFRIGALTDSWGPTPHMIGLRDGLQELGYRENEDFVLGVRFTQGNHAALPAAARDLVQYGVDLIFVTSAQPTRAAQRATRQIPIVFASVEDPVELGLIQSFARPGGNITGVTNLTLELGPKRLEVFRDLIPGLKKVLFPYDANHTPSVVMVKVYRDAARHLGIMLVEKPVQTEAEAQATLTQACTSEVDGILQSPSVSLNIPGFILEAQCMPAMFGGSFFVENGGLASYGPSPYESGRQAARLVDKIFKGAKPAEIPVEVNSKVEFAINLKTAKKLGLTIPPEVLFQANRLIR